MQPGTAGQYVRNMYLGGDVMRGPAQKPFGGKLEYDYVMWIDADVLFTPEQFERLLKHDRDIVSGVYLMEGGKACATVKDWDEAFFEKHGHFRFLMPEDVTEGSGLGTGPG
ncbi:MAG: hypothetical protein GF418_13005 [Chitinivibrionales bacterium]|nr:hypothetical protein [Chitinivibrionales bacterium]MBD3396537.1 hypothetical protein [Chitinivibrionales bacterium]